MSCPDCFKGAAHDGKPAGTEETLHGVLTYIASPPAGPTSSSTIILITDAFGFNLVNSKLLADTYASETGCKVLVPDIIPGGGVPVDSLQLMERASAPVAALDLAGQASRAYNVALMLTRFLPFAIRTRNVFPSVLAYARCVKAELPAGSKLGAAGFCWGALQTINLAKESAVEGGEEPLLAAHFAAHPSGFRTPEALVEACKGRRVPVSIAVGDRDTILSVEAAKTIKEGLEGVFEQEPEKAEVVTYGECGHGFAVRADPAKVVENEGAAKAAEQAVAWFRRYLL
ncbi:Alpha/Beta hydrolase protein [Plectosphaerella plurivora]|uniref:Alpha/Beta hydrolase protein n=1 Tax=Plectosphaerella plurivora TaxID=936078 RepID=A0A9P8V057_9PEZI|nr:Alpha/Beta hydrolase protein [Plectosphaerella plurivora]